MSATQAMIAHRYGNVEPVNPHASMTSARETHARQAALELKQVLDNNGIQHSVKKLSQSGVPTSYTFAFEMPLEQAIQQMSSQASQIAARHGTSIGFLGSFIKDTPVSVLVVANDPILAHMAYQTRFTAR